LSDIIQEHPCEVIALTETWITSGHTPAELIDLTPSGFDLLSCPRSSGRGGGVAFLVRQDLTYSFDQFAFSSFEAISLSVKLPTSSLSLLNVYRPPDTSKHCQPFSIFLSEFFSLLTSFATTPHPFLITGDFNIHVDDSSDNHAIAFSKLLSDANLTQHVTVPTHIHNHTLDLVITSTDLVCVSKIQTLDSSPSDHFPVMTSLDIPSLKHATCPALRSFRRLGAIDIGQFISDLAESNLILSPPSDLTDLIECYNSTLSDLLDRHAPLVTRTCRKPSQPWYTSTLRTLKSLCRKAERTWKRTHSTADWAMFKSSQSKYFTTVKDAKQQYHSHLISSTKGNPRSLWKTIDNLLHRRQPSPLPKASSDGVGLSSAFANYFRDKISTLRLKITSTSVFTSSPHFPSPPSAPATLLQFRTVSQDEVGNALLSSSDKYCDLDPIPTSLLKQCLSVLLPTITNIVNLSLSSGTFPYQFKHSVIKPLLKKSNLDRECLSSYRPVSNLPFISKLIERMVKAQLTEHLHTNSLFNSHQSAYMTHHSTETVLLSIHDHLVQAISHQNITGLCLLDLSAAFDTIDHSILLERLSHWFGFRDTVLAWIASYLCSRTFSVSTNGSVSDASPVLYGVPQGSVLGPLLFLLYTTPLSHLVRTSDVNHHLFADDTQLYISFRPEKFTEAMAALSDVFHSISNWMSANLLALNPTKTEFLLIGRPQQLSKLTSHSLSLTSDVSLTPVHFARNLGFIVDSNLSYHNQISALSKACFYHIRDLRRIRPYLDLETASTIATALVHSKLDYCNSLYLGLPKTELGRLQHIQNALGRVVANTKRHDHITPTLQSLHWLKIQERITYKIISVTYDVLATAKPSYLSSLLTIQSARSTRSSKLITLYRPAITSGRTVLNRSFGYSAPILWNSLPPELRRPKDSGTPGTNLLSKSTFLSKLKTHLFHKSYPDSSKSTSFSTSSRSKPSYLATPWPPD